MNSKKSLSKVQSQPEPITPSLKKKIDLFYNLKNELISEISNADYSSDFVKYVTNALSKADLSFSIFVEEISKNQISRNSSMVCGPSYISKEYPQPIDSMGHEMFPVLQIDMEWIGTVTNRKFDSEFLQLWWSPGDAEECIVIIPKVDVILENALPVVFKEEVLELIKNWIPSDWFCGNESNCYLINKCRPFGVTYPPFEDLIDYNFEQEPEFKNREILLELLNKLCLDTSFKSPKVNGKNIIFNIFGYYKSHSCASWEVESEMCFLHTSQWASGMMDANIFMLIDEDGNVKDFNFGFGR